MGKSIIIVGPQGCGKTLHSKALMQLFGVQRLADPWRPSQGMVPDCLHLTQVAPRDDLPYVDERIECYTFDQAMARLNAEIDKLAK